MMSVVNYTCNRFFHTVPTYLFTLCIKTAIPTRNALQDLSRSCKTYPEQTFKNLIRVFLQDLERFLQESYKICKKCLKILPDSCQILDMIFLVGKKQHKTTKASS